MQKSHKDVEFEVTGHKVQKNFADALMLAFGDSLSLGEKHVSIYVLVHSLSGARWFAQWSGNEDFVQEYKDDPEMSAAHKWTIKVTETHIIR